ncbi:MAG: phosphoribulokinase, partial [Methylibium sp.]|nr:phosphoribulokinase [Methylibium sp.]
MSRKHPVIAVTGSSGAGTSTVKGIFDNIFRREGVRAALIEGDAFHRYARDEMDARIATADSEGRSLSHFGPECNEWELLERQFRSYGETGRCKTRRYLHSTAEAERESLPAGSFTPWTDTPADTDLLFYEG